MAADDFRAPTVPTLPPEAGTYNKTAIVGIENGQSLVRLANLRDEPTRNYVDIYGLTDKATLGSFTVDVPAKASIQFMPELMIYTFAPVNWEQPVVLYVKNGRDKQVWQHVKIDARTGALYDASVCAAPPHLDYAAPGNAALNVYPGYFSRYLSTVSVHNFSDKSGNFEARITDAETGKSVGTVAFTLDPRESFIRNGIWYAGQGTRESPLDDNRYLNVEIVRVGEDTGARVVVGHEVKDLFSGQTTNLSNPCPIHGGLVSIFAATGAQ